MAKQNDDQVQSELAWVAQAVAVIAQAIAALILPQLIVPVAAARIAGERVATKAQFWRTRRWQPIAAVAGALIVAIVTVVEAAAAAGWLRSPAADGFLNSPEKIQAVLLGLVPWLLLNLALGVLLLPAAWLLHRRHLAGVVYRRHISDVQMQERIERARIRAADVDAAARIGVAVDPATGEVTGVHAEAIRAPRRVNGRTAFGVVVHPTVRTLPERVADRRQVPKWIDKSGRYVVVPDKAGSIRGVVVAESGSGKTFLLDGTMLCALEEGHPVFFLDAKGATNDANKLAAIATSLGHTALVSKKWDFFNGSTPAVIAKLLSLISSDNQFYFDEAKGALQTIMPAGPVRSVDELYDRLTTPARFVDIDERGVEKLMREVDKAGTTVGIRVRETLISSLIELAPYIDPNGSSFDKPGADLTIVPLTPVDPAQAKLGAVILLDLMAYLKEELERDEQRNGYTVVDEFPQLVVPGQDPGDLAARLLETMRTGNKGLMLASQTDAGISENETTRKRVLGSGAGLFIGRGKDQEEVAKLAGTVTRIESSGAPTGDELNSARAQNTYALHPNEVRYAHDGEFWLVQGGAVAHFRVLPPPIATAPAGASAEADEEPAEDPQPAMLEANE
jgi:hypothetical protein